MRYLTKDWYMRCQSYPKSHELEKELSGISESCRQAREKEDLPDRLRQGFMFHDGDVLAVSAGKDLIIRIKSPFSDYHTITFIDAVVKQEPLPVGAWWLYEELYRHKSGVGYEVHILSLKASGPRHKKVLASDLFDTKIICSDILLA